MTETPDTRGDGEPPNGARLDEARQRLLALADAYEPGEYALADGVCHVYWEVPECCQTLRDDIRLAVNGELSVAVSRTASPAPLEREAVARVVDSRSWSNFDYWSARPERGIMTADQLERMVAPSYAKADAIIAMTRGKT